MYINCFSYNHSQNNSSSIQRRTQAKHSIASIATVTAVFSDLTHICVCVCLFAFGVGLRTRGFVPMHIYFCCCWFRWRTQNFCAHGVYGMCSSCARASRACCCCTSIRWIWACCVTTHTGGFAGSWHTYSIKWATSCVCVWLSVSVCSNTLVNTSWITFQAQRTQFVTTHARSVECRAAPLARGAPNCACSMPSRRARVYLIYVKNKFDTTWTSLLCILYT